MGVLIIAVLILFSLETCEKLSSLFNGQKSEDEEDLVFQDTDNKDKPNFKIQEEQKPANNEIVDLYKSELEPKEEIEHITPPVTPPQPATPPPQPPVQNPPPAPTKKVEEKSAVDTFYKNNPPAQKPTHPVKIGAPTPKKEVAKPRIEKPKKIAQKSKDVGKKVTPMHVEQSKPKVAEKPKKVKKEKSKPLPPAPAADEAAELDSLISSIPLEKEEAPLKKEDSMPKPEPKQEIPEIAAPMPEKTPEKQKDASKDSGDIDLENLGLNDFTEDTGFVEEPKNFVPTEAPEKESLTAADYDKYNIILSITPKYEGSIFTIELQGTKDFILGNRNPKVTAKIYKLKTPYRTAIDFVNAKFASIPETIEISHIESPIEKITTKYFEEKDKHRTIARVVIHLKRQAIFKKDLKSNTLLKISFR